MNKDTPCPGCPNEPPEPLPGNLLFTHVFRTTIGFRSGDGWLDYSAVFRYLDLLGLSASEREDVLEKMSVVEGELHKKKNLDLQKNLDEMKKSMNKQMDKSAKKGPRLLGSGRS